MSGAAGFDPADEREAAPLESADDASQASEGRNKQRPEPVRKSDEWKRNFKSVFGQGIGRISLIGTGIVVFTLIALGVRNLTSTAPKRADDGSAYVEVPNAPDAPIGVSPISAQEAARRNDASAQEAAQAQQSGDSYQPAFMPNITTGQESTAPTDVFSNDNKLDPPKDMPVNVNTNAEAERKLLEEARRRQEQALADATKARDEFVTKKRQLVLEELNTLMKDGALNKLGSYSTFAYTIPVAAASAEGGTSAATTQGGQAEARQRRTPVIRTGNVLYAETSSEINTDDGTDAMAVIRGGVWDGSKLIGKIENKPNNIGLRFTTLAPQDGRPAMAINAIALRTEDASQGIAEDIDHHTLERYAALGFSSLLSGYGKAYSESAGTSVIAPSGTTVTTTEEPSSKRVLATTLGELGSNASQEIQRGFNRPTTYSTPANHGIAVYFMADVFAPEE